MKISVIILLVCFLALVGCKVLNNEMQGQVYSQSSPNLPAIEEVTPLVEVEVDGEAKLNKPLKLHWRITNLSNEPIYVYSSLLKYSAGADIMLDTKEKTIEIRFTRFDQISLNAYAFSSAEFVKVESKKSFEGQFVGNKPIGQKDYYDSKDTGVKLQQITDRKWQVNLAIAYNNEIDTVQKDLAVLVENGSKEHPINPIVRWQKIAYSKPVTITFHE